MSENDLQVGTITHRTSINSNDWEMANSPHMQIHSQPQVTRSPPIMETPQMGCALVTAAKFSLRSALRVNGEDEAAEKWVQRIVAVKVVRDDESFLSLENRQWVEIWFHMAHDEFYVMRRNKFLPEGVASPLEETLEAALTFTADDVLKIMAMCGE